MPDFTLPPIPGCKTCTETRCHRHRAGEEAQRFWSHVNKGGPNDCWEWTSSRTEWGYGRFARTIGADGPRVVRAHRYSFELHFGEPIPPGMFVCHRCDNPPCVNPAHLFIGTHTDNMHDMASKGRRYEVQPETCPNGHRYEVTGFTIHPTEGYRRCLECRKESARRCYERRKARKRSAA